MMSKQEAIDQLAYEISIIDNDEAFGLASENILRTREAMEIALMCIQESINNN